MAVLRNTDGVVFSVPYTYEHVDHSADKVLSLSFWLSRVNVGTSNDKRDEIFNSENLSRITELEMTEWKTV